MHERDQINAATKVTSADDFRHLERTRLQALIDKDLELAHQLHAPGFQLITPTGAVYARDAYLNAVALGELNYLRWQPFDIDVRVFPEVALLRYRADLVMGKDPPGSHAFSCWHTDSYELRHWVWRVVWSQATLIK